MLFVLYQMASGGGPRFSSAQGRRAGLPNRRRHGRGLRADGRRDRRLASPVAAGTAIDQDADGVTVRSDDMTVRARGFVAVPIAIASQILYEPMLPVDRSFLHQRMPSGASQDQHRLRRAVLARRRPVRAVGGTGITRDGHHRCVDRRPAAGRSVRDRRGPDRTSDRRARRERERSERSWPNSSGGSAPGPHRRSTTSSSAGPPSATRAAGCSATRRPVCSPSSDLRCGNRAAASTGPEPRARRSCAAGLTGRSAPVSGPHRGHATRK